MNISADGKCSSPEEATRQLAENDEIETLELVIDGTCLLGGNNTPTLLGSSHDFLPASRMFKLSHFEPQTDGRCIAHYVRSTH